MDVSLSCNNEPKLIAVMGATGAQGGSVVKALQNMKGFEVRAITRDPESEKAKSIAPLVKEIVKADGDDEASMVEAFKGCYGAFIVSNFWQDMNADHEMKTLRTIKDALKKAQLEHVVLSTLECTIDAIDKAENKDSWKVLKEDPKMYVPHFDSKGIVTKEYLDAGINVTCFNTSFYYENFIYFGMGPAQHDPSQPHSITFPLAQAKMPIVAVQDIGKFAANLFTDPSTIGKEVGVASEHLTGEEIAAAFTKVCGYKVLYNAVPTEVYAGFGFPGAEDLANMFRYYVEYEDSFCGMRPLDVCDKRTGGTTKLEAWIKENKGAFELKKE
jgi:uncharacterized protein YbjT (DUF2867 family)